MKVGEVKYGSGVNLERVRLVMETEVILELKGDNI